MLKLFTQHRAALPSRLTCLLLLAVFIFFAAVTALWRFSRGLHWEQVHVEVISTPATDDIRVYFTSQFGSRGELVPGSSPGVFSQTDNVPGVARLFLSSSDSDRLACASVRVSTGRFFIEPLRRLHSVQFGPINWQDDHWVREVVVEGQAGSVFRRFQGVLNYWSIRDYWVHPGVL